MWIKRVPAWWRHQMETFSALLGICAGIHRPPVNSPHKGQWPGALMFALICAWINGWVNNRESGDLRRLSVHYDVTVIGKLLDLITLLLKAQFTISLPVFCRVKAWGKTVHKPLFKPITTHMSVARLRWYNYEGINVLCYLFACKTYMHLTKRLEISNTKCFQYLRKNNNPHW